MTELTDEQKVQIARGDFSFYQGWAHKVDVLNEAGVAFQAIPQPHHTRMIYRLEDVSQIVLKQGDWKSYGQERHTAIVAPPGSAKTTILQGFYEWLLGRASLKWGKNWADIIHLGHVSHSADQAWRMSFAVRETIESNDVFKMCFPDVQPDEVPPEARDRAVDT